MIPNVPKRLMEALSFVKEDWAARRAAMRDVQAKYVAIASDLGPAYASDALDAMSTHLEQSTHEFLKTLGGHAAVNAFAEEALGGYEGIISDEEEQYE